MNEKITIVEKWITAEKATFCEEMDPNDKTKKRYVLDTLIVPFGKISRNGIKYNEKKTIKTHKLLEGKPLMHNHVLDGSDVLSRGEWFETRIETDGMHGKARVFDTDYNKDYIQYLENTTSPRVSLQITGEVEQKKENGKYYQEAYIQDWLEASTVNVAGFDQARGSFVKAVSEAFNGKPKNTENIEKSFFEKLDSVRMKAKLDIV